MLFDLTRSASFVAENPPLVFAVAQARYPTMGQLATLGGVTPIQERVRAVLPYMDPVQIQEIAILSGPGGPVPPSVGTEGGWQFSDDHGHTLVLLPGSASCAIGNGYQNIQTFLEPFRALLEALDEEVEVPRCDRLGLRYVNLVPLGAEGDEWAAWFKPALTGLAGSHALDAAARPVVDLAQAHIIGAEGARAGVTPQGIIRYGLIPPNAVIPIVGPGGPQPIADRGFLLDMDFFFEGHQPFNAVDLAAELVDLNVQAATLFRWSLTEAGERHFGISEVSDANSRE